MLENIECTVEHGLSIQHRVELILFDVGHFIYVLVYCLCIEIPTLPKIDIIENSLKINGYKTFEHVSEN